MTCVEVRTSLASACSGRSDCDSGWDGAGQLGQLAGSRFGRDVLERLGVVPLGNVKMREAHALLTTSLWHLSAMNYILCSSKDSHANALISF